MRSPEERISSLEAFHTAHGGEHGALEGVLNRRFDDLKEHLSDLEKRFAPKNHIHTPGSSNGVTPREIIVKLAFPSAGIGAGVVSVLYWVAQVIGK